MRKYFSGVVLSAALLTPVLAYAEERHEVKRYYDRNARDWHPWDDRESEAYRRYQAERNRNNREFNKLNRRDQNDYWKWRHEHSEGEHR